METIIKEVDLIELQFTKFHSQMPPLNKKGFNVIENSSKEIYDATLDILNLTREKRLEKFKWDKVSAIRQELKSPCNGEIAPSYLQENQSWFLQN